MGDLIEDFLFESEEGIRAIDGYLVTLEKNPSEENAIWQAMRILHTIKGTCGFMGFNKLMQVSHFGEDILMEVKDKKSVLNKEKIDLLFEVTQNIIEILTHIKQFKTEPETDYITQLSNRSVAKVSATEISIESNHDEFVKIRSELLDEMMYSVEELILAQKELSSEKHSSSILQQVSKLTNLLQMRIADARLQPLDVLFSTYPKIVRNLANQLGKEVDFEIEGADTTIDKGIIQLIKEPITHLIRNALDHGIESKEARISSGKSPKGKVKISAKASAGKVCISIHDDGGGLNTLRIKDKIISNNLLSPEELALLSEKEVQQYIFAQGFSTAQSISDISGRGVGLDIAKGAIEKAGGSLAVTSMEEVGTSFTITLPSHINISDALVTKCGGATYLIPTQSIHKIIDPKVQDSTNLKSVNGALVYQIGESILPVLPISSLFQDVELHNAESLSSKQIIIMHVNDKLFAVAVEMVEDVDEVIVRPNPSILNNVSIISGVVILDNAEIALMLDPVEMLENIGINNAISADLILHDITKTTDDTAEYIFFTTANDSSSVKAIPIKKVNKFISLPASALREISGTLVAKYLDAPIRIANAETDGHQPQKTDVSLLICKCHEENVGLIIEKVLAVQSYDESLPQLKLSNSEVGFHGSEPINFINLENIFSKEYSKIVMDHAYKEPSKHVILIDDSPFFRKLIPPVLMKAGFKVSVVEDVHNAISLLKSHKEVDAVITDAETPGLKELEFIEALQRGQGCSNIPIVALSSVKSWKSEDSAIENGFDAFIPKLQHAKLVETLNELTV